MSDDTIRPALMAEEWANGTKSFDGHGDIAEVRVAKNGNLVISGVCQSDGDGNEYFAADAEERPALAALALYGQPFGFTWEDVDALREEVEVATERAAQSVSGYNPWPRIDRLSDLATRIAALLPPRE